MSLSGLYVMGWKLTYYNPDFNAAAVILLIHLCISLNSFSFLFVVPPMWQYPKKIILIISKTFEL